MNISNVVFIYDEILFSLKEVVLIHKHMDNLKDIILSEVRHGQKDR